METQKSRNRVNKNSTIFSTEETDNSSKEIKKIVVSAEKFNNFETMSLNRQRSISTECINSKNSTELDTETTELIAIGEAHKPTDNILKATDNDKMAKVGEIQSPIEASHENLTSSSSVFNKTTSPTSVNNRAIIITNLAGKKVSIIPKSPPVVLNNCEDSKPVFVNSVVKKSVYLKPMKVIKPLNIYVTKPMIKPSVKPLIKPIPNAAIMKISDLNKSQQYFNSDSKYCNLKIQKTESLAESSKKIFYSSNKVCETTNKKIGTECQTIDNIDLTHEKKIDVSCNKVSDFSKFLQVLAESEQEGNSVLSLSENSKIPIYVDGQTQTDNLKIVKDQAVQTEAYIPSPVPSEDDLPNITNLLEYVLNTPKYSTGLDEGKKSNLIDMSKNIVLKGKMMATSEPRNQDQLKRQLFLDLKDCATFDFLGNKPIHNAVLDNNLILLKRQIFALRLRRFSLDIENNLGQTALQLAVVHNCNLDLIYQLLLSGASTNIQDNEGNTLIHLAVTHSTHTVLELIIHHLKEPVKEINRKNDEGLTALMLAAIDSKPELVDLLLRSGADPNLRDDKSGRTALFHAVELNCNFVINLLLKHKADPKVRNYFGLTALDAAKDLDIADAKMLEDEKEERNQTSVIVNMGRSPEKRTAEAGKGEAKRAKLSFVASFQKIEAKPKSARGTSNCNGNAVHEMSSSEADQD